MGPISCPETSIQNYHSTLRNTPEERKSLLLTSWRKGIRALDRLLQLAEHRSGVSRMLTHDPWIRALGNIKLKASGASRGETPLLLVLLAGQQATSLPRTHTHAVTTAEGYQCQINGFSVCRRWLPVCNQESIYWLRVVRFTCWIFFHTVGLSLGKKRSLSMCVLLRRWVHSVVLVFHPPYVIWSAVFVLGVKCHLLSQ
jgi:hypothetical protein